MFLGKVISSVFDVASVELESIANDGTLPSVAVVLSTKTHIGTECVAVSKDVDSVEIFFFGAWVVLCVMYWVVVCLVAGIVVWSVMDVLWGVVEISSVTKDVVARVILFVEIGDFIETDRVVFILAEDVDISVFNTVEDFISVDKVFLVLDCVSKGMAFAVKASIPKEVEVTVKLLELIPKVSFIEFNFSVCRFVVLLTVSSEFCRVV